MRYIAKPNTWYKESTEATYICAVTEDSVLFRGIRVKQNTGESPARAFGEEYLDEEVCSLEEFDIIEEDNE